MVQAHCPVWPRRAVHATCRLVCLAPQVLFEPSTATDPATVRCSSTAASTAVNSTAPDSSTVYNASTTTSTTACSTATNPSSVCRSSTTTTSTTVNPSTTTSSVVGQPTANLSAATASTTRDTTTTPLETVCVPSCESSRPSRYCLVTSTSSSTTTDLGDCAYDSDRHSSLHSTDSTCLDPLAPMFTPKFISASPFTATHPSVSVLLPVDFTSTTDPHPYAKE